jgi:hypothetical protein
LNTSMWINCPNITMNFADWLCLLVIGTAYRKI